VAVLGTRDQPTDALEEYCRYLAAGLAKHDIELELIRVPWAEVGWATALDQLEQQIRAAHPKWALLQYTALGWSRRGFPWRVLEVLRTLKKSGSRCAAVVHDPAPYPGERLVDQVRRAIQTHVMRRMIGLTDLNVLTTPLETVSWLPSNKQHLRFVPVGANLPHPEAAWDLNARKPEIPTISVFGVTGGPSGDIEVARIGKALRVVSGELGPVRVSMLGRNSENGGKELKKRLEGTQVEVVVHGLLEAQQVVKTLGSSEVMLFVRGPISTRRGSALAGIACGLPVVACEGWETAGPIKDAGVVLLPQNSGKEYGQALLRVLKDGAYRQTLREQSRNAQRNFFSWEVISEEYAALLRRPA
jgi:glycosyltransferase involved in cell wall biosynthesis